MTRTIREEEALEIALEKGYESYETKQEALDALGKLEGFENQKGEFVTGDRLYFQRGQYARTRYKPQRYHDGWGIKAVEFYHARTPDAPKNRRVNIKDLVRE